MNIKDRIKSLGSYFKEMQITTINGEQIIYVVISFPNNWMIDEDILEKYNVQVQEGTNRGEFYFCADIETGEEAIFDAIEHNINKMKSAIERANLLRAKIEELKNIFEDESISLDQLRNLTFTFPPKSENTQIENITTTDLSLNKFFNKTNEKNKKGSKKNTENATPEKIENLENE